MQSQGDKVNTSLTSGWENFFVAEAGASAALSGLVFVAVSINLTRILSFPHLPGRAGQTLVVLVSVLTVSTLGLIPGQSSSVLGMELVGVGCVGVLCISSVQYRARHHLKWPVRPVLLVLLTQVPLLPYIIAGVLLALGRPGALYWLVPGVLLCFAAGILNAWVLLVEILR
jgi:hypothetical protein